MSTFFTPLKATLYQLLYRRTILLLALLLCIGVTGALWNTSGLSSSLIRSHALQSAVMYAQAMKNARTLYSDAVVDRIDDVQSIRVTHDYALADNSIPLPATFLIELGQRIRQENPEISVRLFSDYPFPWRQAEGTESPIASK
ncbi:MAG: hypothetical protein WBC69_01385 [Geitlerinemataceae cyanobacterium]